MGAPAPLVDLDLPLQTEAPAESGPVSAPAEPWDSSLGRNLSALDRELEGMGLSTRPREVDRPLDDEIEEAGEGEWETEVDLAPSPAPVSRPARAGERFGAAAVDLALMGGLALTVVYFASRVAHVPLTGLAPAAPWIAAWLVGVGLSYAAFFTGTTGQTLGKIAIGLRVVDVANRPPSYGCALMRAALGFVGVALAGAGLLPLLLDPARRTLHDRLFRTRVIRG